MCCPQINLFQDGKRIDAVWGAAHRRAFQDKQECRLFVQLQCAPSRGRGHGRPGPLGDGNLVAAGRHPNRWAELRRRRAFCDGMFFRKPRVPADSLPVLYGPHNLLRPGRHQCADVAIQLAGDASGVKVRSNGPMPRTKAWHIALLSGDNPSRLAIFIL